MRILITGAAGFLGSRVARRLRSPSTKVVTTDRWGDVEHVGDLSDPSFVQSLPDIDVLVHLSSVQYVSTDLPLFGRRRYFSENNVRSAQNLINRYRGVVELVVNTSTSMVYSGSAQSPIREDQPIGFNGIYSESKIQVEHLLSGWDVPVATVRPCIIAGPGRGGLFIPLQRALLSRRILVVPGPGNFRTSVVDVEDVAALVEVLVSTGRPGVFNCAGTDALSVREWGGVLAQELGVTHYRDLNVPLWIVRFAAVVSGYRLLAREQLAMLSRDHTLDTSNARKTGWRPVSSTTDILRATAVAFRDLAN